MLFDRHHFHFFRNREIDSLYISLALIQFAEAFINVFVPIYLWKLGFLLWQILFFYFLASLYFLIVLILLLPLIKKLSDKMMMSLGIAFHILYFLGLAAIGDHIILFYLLPLPLAIHFLLFNVGYHMDFSSAAEREFVGREMGTRYMIGALVQFSAPFIGGILVSIVDFRSTFLTGSIILLLSLLPLFFFAQRTLSKTLTTASIYHFLFNKTLLPFTISGAGYATEIMVGGILWPLYLFIIIGSIAELGGIISLGLLASALITYVVGVLSDTGKRRSVISLTAKLFSLVWLTRPFMTTPFAGLLSHVGGNLVNAPLMVAWSSQYYKLAKTVPDASSFILSREALYHLARIVFLPVLIILTYFLPNQLFFSLSFVLAALLTLLFLFANKLHTREASNL